MVLKESISNFTERNSRHVGSEESFSTERRSMSSDSERTNEKGDVQKHEYQSELEDDEDTSSVSAIMGFRNRGKGKNKNKIKIKGKGKELNKRENEDFNETTILGNDTNGENQTTITNKSIILFQISLFILYFIILLIGSCNFSFKLFQAKEKHLHESVANMKAPACASILKEKLNQMELPFKKEKIKEVFYEKGSAGSSISGEHKIDSNMLHKSEDKKGRNKEFPNENSEIENKNNRHINAFFKYYFTRTKRFLKNEDKTQKHRGTITEERTQSQTQPQTQSQTQAHNGRIKIFICLNSNGSIEYRNLYSIFFSFKGYLFRFLSFSWNEIKNVFVKKKQEDFLEFFDNTTNINTYIINHYLYYYYLLNKNKYARLNKGYVNVEILFYMYLKNICYLHNLNYINEKQEQHSEYGWIQQLLYYDEAESRLNWESKKNVGFIINRINEYLKDETFLNVLNSLYAQICRNDFLWNYLKKGDVCNTEKKDAHQNLEEDRKGHKHTDCFSYERYYNLYNRIDHFREINKFSIWENMMKRKLNTVRVLKKLDNCTKRYIINLKNVPLNFFLNIFYDTPCYVYNKLITNLLSNYCKGLFLYFIIFLGCIHVFFSPFPITLVHFRRFFIYFLIIMYRLFIFYFIPSIIQYIFYKYTNFDEELKHIFDYSDHVILFSTLLFIISLETQAIKYTINHQKQSFDNFHYKYNRNLCFIFLKLVLYYYYMLIFLFLYTSYFTSKYFHTPNEIFVAYFFSTFSIFILFYFFLYKGYFSFYNLGITSFVCKEATVSPSAFPTPFLSNSNSILILKEKLSFD